MKTGIFNNKHFKANAFNVFGNFVVKGANIVFVIYFAYIMTAAEFGKASTFMAYAAVLSAVIGLNLYSSLEGGKEFYKEEYRDYKSATLFLSIISTLVISVLGLIFVSPLSEILHLPKDSIVLLFVYSGCMSIYMFFHHEYISAFDYMGSVSMSAFDIFFGFAMALVFINFVLPDKKVMAKELGVTVPLVIIAIYVMVKTFARGKHIASKEYWSFALAASVPNILYIVSQDVLAYSDRIFIVQLFGYKEVGIYSLVHYLGLFMTLLWSGTNGFWTPWIFEKLKNGQEDVINKNLKKYLFSFSAGTVSMSAILPFVIKYIMPPAYLGGVKIITPIVLSGFFMCLYSLMANLEFYHKKSRYIVLGTIAAAVGDIVLNAIFIPLYGFEAAAYTTLAGSVLLFAFHFFVANNLLKINVYKKAPFVLSIAVTCALCAAMDILWLFYM
ncbi:MAG: hypothetical protein E7539_07130 [Ruminococcaceae bacterium]|nr:hypothetical protein [Oscillospiraceae bacterium]